MPVRLRGHHFLCLLTYRGLGYSAPFIANLDRVAAAVADGQPVRLVAGPDDICAGLTEACIKASGHDCHDPDTARMDAEAITDVEPLLGRSLADAAPVTPSEVRTLRKAFAAGTIRRACGTCPWHATCTGIAAGGYAEVKLPSTGAAT
ncbi:MAG: DUF1284 domain-containing protein [Rhizobiaceae bacterium]|jgi:hypothetical protein|nr:DUF1284 domain-containing protein [Rhizobiaceae bacterium]